MAAVIVDVIAGASVRKMSRALYGLFVILSVSLLLSGVLIVVTVYPS